MSLDTCLRIASETLQQRGDQYGDAAAVHRDIAAAWSLILGMTVTPGQVCQCMVMSKMIREVYSPGHSDNWVDTAGYAAIGHMLAGGP